MRLVCQTLSLPSTDRYILLHIHRFDVVTPDKANKEEVWVAKEEPTGDRCHGLIPEDAIRDEIAESITCVLKHPHGCTRGTHQSQSPPVYLAVIT